MLIQGVFSKPKHLGFENYLAAWEQMKFARYFLNTVIIIVPAVFFILLFSGFIAFLVTHFKFKFAIPLQVLLTAGGLLPPQIIFLPLFRLYISVGDALGNKNMFFDSFLGVILVHIVTQIGFTTLVLSSYFKTLPREISEQSQMDGASLFRQFRSIIVPMSKAPIFTMGLLLTTWIYNDFFWGLALIKTNDLYPVTTALGRIGAFSRVIQNPTVLAAGAILTALPPLLLFISFRKRFLSPDLFRAQMPS